MNFSQWRSKILGPHVAAFFSLALFFLSISTILRIGFLFIFKNTALESTLQHLPKAFYLGLKFDIRVTLLLMLPLLLLSWIPILDFTRNQRAVRFWRSLYAVILSMYMASHLFDFGYYSYLETRVNASVLVFLLNPMISLQVMWDTYPLGWAILATLVFMLFIYWLLAKTVFIDARDPLPKLSAKRRLITVIATFVIVVSGLYGKISAYPLRWSEAYFSQDAFVSALTMNPIHYFFDTLGNREHHYNEQAVKQHYSIMSEYLGLAPSASESLSFARPVKQTPMFSSKPNIVIVVMESMAAYKTGILGHPLDPTPNLDHLAQNSILFSDFYVPVEGTARSMFCLLTGIPDLGVNRTSSRNPLIISQNTIVNAFKDYEKYYFIGGSANWGNIRGVYNHNVKGVKIIEEGMYHSPRTDVWGISDLHLFEESHEKLELLQDRRPFFAIIQTAGFHRPYTIPEDKRGFKEQILSDQELKRSGFVSNAEYNSLRFSDHALGRFFELAKKSKYYDNTLFVILGDHGLPDKQAQHVSLGRQFHLFERFRVPLVFHAPKLIDKPQVIDKIATEPDIMPTLAGITGHKFTNTSMGRNLFAKEYDQQRYAFQYVYHRSPALMGLMDKEFFVSGEAGNITGLYRYNSDTPTLDVKAEFPDKYRQMKELAMAYFETAKYMLYHNRNLLEDAAKASTQPSR